MMCMDGSSNLQILMPAENILLPFWFTVDQKALGKVYGVIDGILKFGLMQDTLY